MSNQIFKYINLQDSIYESPDFSFILKLNEWIGFTHITDILTDQKIKDPNLKEIFKNKITKILFDEIDYLSRFDNKNINKNLLDQYCRNDIAPNKKIILCRSDEYNNIASFFPNQEFENNTEKNTIFLNMSLLEKASSNGIIPSNANIILSALIYTYTLLVLDNTEPTEKHLIILSKIFTTLFMSIFGRQFSLQTADEEIKESFSFIISSFIYSKFSTNPTNHNLVYFLRKVSATYNLKYINYYFKFINSFNLPYNIHNSITPENFDNINKLVKVFNVTKIMEIDINSFIIKLFKFIGLYGLMSFSKYDRLVAYFIATNFPNTNFTTVLKVYNKQSYDTLIKEFIKLVYIKGRGIR